MGRKHCTGMETSVSRISGMEYGKKDRKRLFLSGMLSGGSLFGKDAAAVILPIEIILF